VIDWTKILDVVSLFAVVEDLMYVFGDLLVELGRVCNREQDVEQFFIERLQEAEEKKLWLKKTSSTNVLRIW
jgi:hypothetical protein